MPDNVPSPIEPIAPDAPVSRPKSTAQTVAETLVDLAALSILGAALLTGKVSGQWLQGGAILGILLLAGVRVADIVALSKGLPSRGGPAALLLAGLGGLAARVTQGGA